MQRKNTLLGGVAVCAIASFGLVAAAGATTPAKHHHHHAAMAAAVHADDKVAALSSEVETLENRLTAESQAREQLQGQVQAATAQAQAAQADAQAAHQQLAEQIQTIPGEVKADIAAEHPKDGKVHYKGVTLTVGGFAAAESVYRSKNEEADIGSSFAKIPFSNNPVSHTAEERFTARQSRLSLLAEGDISPDTHAAFYSEFDFLAGPQTANSNESNSFSPRIRNVYGTLDMGNVEVLAGQNWSLTTMNTKGITPRNELTPTTIDAQYVVGFTWARQPQLRITDSFANKQIWAAVSLENPQTVIGSAATGTTGGTSVSGLTVTTGEASTSQFDSANTLTLNHIPDVVGKLAFEPDIGGSRPIHAEVYGIYRSYYDRVNVTGANVLGLPVGASNQDTSGGGIGGGVTWTVVPKFLDLQASALTGRGIGRYGSGSLSDAIVAPNGSLKPIPETMYLFGGTLHATPGLDLYLYYGSEKENAVTATIGGKGYGYGSSTASNLGLACATEGATCAPDLQQETQWSGGLWDKIYTGPFGQVRVGLQYSYTQLTGFAGAAGGAPKTNDNMIFTSFRYYPF
jgi:hypothetical protein